MAEFLVDNQLAANTGTPVSGATSITVDSVTKRLRTKDDAGLVVDYVGVDTTQTLTGKTLSSATLIAPNIGAATGTSLTVSGAILSSGAGIGYTIGAGGTVTQITSKATGVTLNKLSGQITMINSALNAGVIVSFVLTNSFIAAGDVLILNHSAVGTVGAYLLNTQCAAGSATINVRNTSAVNLSEAIVISFVLIKAVTS